MYYTYIMADKFYGTLYIGVTSNLVKRVFEHKNGFVDGFTKKYSIKCLVYFESFEDVRAAIHREKRLKTWLRKWKIDLINSVNPEWQDLYEEIIK